jgi:hypothetical protein
LGRFVGDADYAVRWPTAVLEQELRRLIDRARQHGLDGDWEAEVKLLLSQAFSSSVPAEDFETLLRAYTGFDDEPF